MKLVVIVGGILFITLPLFAETVKLRTAFKPQSIQNIQYNELKKSLEIEDKDLTRTDVLEIIAVRYADMFDRAQEILTSLDRQLYDMEQKTKTIENDVNDISRRVKKIEQDVAEHENKLDKLFAWSDKVDRWSCKVDDEIFNEFGFGAIGGIRQYINKCADNINNNANNINALDSEINQIRAELNRLNWSIQNFR